MHNIYNPSPQNLNMKVNEKYISFAWKLIYLGKLEIVNTKQNK